MDVTKIMKKPFVINICFFTYRVTRQFLGALHVQQSNDMTTPEQAVEPAVKYSDFIIYVDESGDHSLDSIDPAYPVFVLSFCIFRKDSYAEIVAPAIRKLKFATFGHDMVVLHESDIRRKKGAFSRLSKAPRDAFLNTLTDIIAVSDFQLVAVVIDKRSEERRVGKECRL